MAPSKIIAIVEKDRQLLSHNLELLHLWETRQAHVKAQSKIMVIVEQDRQLLWQYIKLWYSLFGEGKTCSF